MYNAAENETLRDFNGASVLLIGVSDLISEGLSVEEVASKLGVSARFVTVVRDMKPLHSSMLCNYLRSKEITKLSVNYDKVVSAAFQVSSMDYVDISNIHKSFNQFITIQNWGEKYFLLQAYDIFVRMILNNLSEVSRLDNEVYPETVLPKKLVVALSDMNQLQLNIFKKIAYGANALNFTVDKEALKHCLDDYEKRASDINTCIELARRGANCALINKEQQAVNVTESMVDYWREVYEVSKDN